MIMVALSTIAKAWKQPKCASTDDGIKKTWNLKWILLIHKNDIMQFASK